MMCALQVCVEPQLDGGRALVYASGWQLGHVRLQGLSKRLSLLDSAEHLELVSGSI